MSAIEAALPKTSLLPYEAAVRILESIGVDTVFGGSGEADAVLLIALKGTPAIKTVTVRNEQAASFMACGYAMFSDRLGVCFSTAGPGEFNLLSGLALALSDSLPVLALSGFVGAAGIGKGALNEASGLHRTPNSPAIFAATTKGNFMVGDPGETCNVLEDAINLALEGRPGPVHVHVPADVADRPLTDSRDIQLHTQPVSPEPATTAAAARLLAAAIESGERVLALLGYGVNRSHAEARVLKLFRSVRHSLCHDHGCRRGAAGKPPIGGRRLRNLRRRVRKRRISGVVCCAGGRQLFRAERDVRILGRSFQRQAAHSREYRPARNRQSLSSRLRDNSF